MAACGGIIRNAKGEFIRGFSCNLGACSVLQAELLALLNDLRVARNLGLPKVIFETDSKAIINYVLRGSIINFQLKSLLEEIISFFRLPDWQILLQHSFKEANKCADFLAKSGLEAPQGFHLVDAISPALGTFVLNDCKGDFTPRFVS